MKIKVASSNIRFDNPKDGNHDWNHRRAVLSSALIEFSPDLLGTQEGRKPQIKDLETLLPNLKLIDDHRDWMEERMYPTLFYKPEIINVFESGDFWLSETPKVPGSKSFDSAFPRLCTWAKMSIPSKELSFYALNCHLDHIRSSTRKEQIRVLIKEFLKINTQDLPFLLMGDFNEGPNESVRQELNQGFDQLFDSWLSLNQVECSSHHNFDGKEEGRRIDWILNTAPFLTHSAFFFKNHIDGIYPSDHYPYFVELLV